MLLRGPVADLLVSDGGEVLELEDVNVLCKALVQAKDPPPLRELQREVALLLRQENAEAETSALYFESYDCKSFSGSLIPAAKRCDN